MKSNININHILTLRFRSVRAVPVRSRDLLGGNLEPSPSINRTWLGGSRMRKVGNKLGECGLFGVGGIIRLVVFGA